MSDIVLANAEGRFADLLWDLSPISTTELVAIAADRFSWKRTTTHTVIRRLCDKGLFVNNHGTITPRISRDDFYAQQGRRFVDIAYNGSLPRFVSGFVKTQKLSEGEIEDILKIISSLGS